jgi:uncharacterized repeat protein (TIGR01451 family)
MRQAEQNTAHQAMKKTMKKTMHQLVKQAVQRWSVAVMAVLLAGPALAQTEGPINFANIAQKQVTTVDENGDSISRLTDVGIVVPGDTIVYTSTFTNISSEVVSNISVTNPVPTNTNYVRFSATGDTTNVTFSIDGGSQYAAPGDLIVTEANGVTRAAKPSEYTHIRWLYQGNLAPGEASNVRFKVTIP